MGLGGSKAHVAFEERLNEGETSIICGVYIIAHDIFHIPISSGHTDLLIK